MSSSSSSNSSNSGGQTPGGAVTSGLSPDASKSVIEESFHGSAVPLSTQRRQSFVESLSERFLVETSLTEEGSGIRASDSCGQGDTSCKTICVELI